MEIDQSLTGKIKRKTDQHNPDQDMGKDTFQFWIHVKYIFSMGKSNKKNEQI
jgi:hypothetical protein